MTAHRAVPGGYEVEEREGKRTAVFGERPVYTEGGQTLSEQDGKAKAKVNGVAPNGL